MKYNFDETTNRRGSNSLKWDSCSDSEVLPMWVADMDFRVASPIIEAMHRRAEHGVFGYVNLPEEYYAAAINWFASRHGFNFRKEWMLFVPGVVPALSVSVKALTNPGDKVLIQTPVYPCFFSSIRNNGCEFVSSPLIYKDNTYSIDYDDLEAKASDPDVKVMILCNPHNPAGRVWTRGELAKIGEICLRHNIFVVSDEIHCELTYPGHDYTPFGSISEEFLMHSVTCNSPTKAFNIAGLKVSNIVCADDSVRAKIDRAININEVCDMNPFGVDSLIAAYNECGDWLDEVRVYLYDNYKYLCSVFAAELPDFPVTKLEGTYLPWVDCSVLGIGSQEIEDRLKSDWKVWINAGIHYGIEGDSFIRINIACPRKTLEEGLHRIVSGLQALKQMLL